jgi:hypothetical protein
VITDSVGLVVSRLGALVSVMFLLLGWELVTDAGRTRSAQDNIPIT